MMKRENIVTRTDVISAIAIFIMLSVILTPVFYRIKTARVDHCQSNMRMIGKAVEMYLLDWSSWYPTQRLNPPMNTFIAPQMTLSNPAKLDPVTGEPIRFENGSSWVEALYPYIGRAVQEDRFSVWRCPAAKAQKVGGNFAAVTYSFNANLIEMGKGGARNTGKLLMVRELSAVYNSVLRPASQTMSSAPAPSDPFLDATEPGAPTPVKFKMHGDGSNILFADGHVKNLPASYFAAVCQWDAASGQWYNFVSNVPTNDPRRLSIAINP